jgi:hypothetical protein
MKFTKPLLITKLKATAVHLLMSIAVFIYLAYQIYYNWYPEPYFSTDGGWQGIRLIGAVDLVLGPIITFLIFDLRKSRRAIVFDIVVIVVIQFAALSFGVYTTYTQRPVAIVFFDSFVISSTMEQYAGTLESASDLERFSDEKPPIIFADIPMTHEALDEVRRIKLEEKVLEHAQLQLYRSRAELATALKERQEQVLERLKLTEVEQAFDDWLQQNGKSKDKVLIERFPGRYGSAWLVFDLDAKYLGYFARM